MSFHTNVNRDPEVRENRDKMMRAINLIAVALSYSFNWAKSLFYTPLTLILKYKYAS